MLYLDTGNRPIPSYVFIENITTKVIITSFFRKDYIFTVFLSSVLNSFSFFKKKLNSNFKSSQKIKSLLLPIFHITSKSGNRNNVILRLKANEKISMIHAFCFMQAGRWKVQDRSDENKREKGKRSTTIGGKKHGGDIRGK